MAPRAGQIFRSMMIVLLILGATFGTAYVIDTYPIVGAIGATVIAICFFTWIVWTILYPPPDPYDL